MKVTVNEHSYVVEFEYWAPEQTREITTCRIRDASSPSPGDGSYPVVASAYVRRHQDDLPNRELARKEALRKALSNLDANVPIAEYAPPARENLHRERRRLFWKAYFARKVNPEAVVREGFEALLKHARSCKVGPQGCFQCNAFQEILQLLRQSNSREAATRAER